MKLPLKKTASTVFTTFCWKDLLLEDYNTQ